MGSTTTNLINLLTAYLWVIIVIEVYRSQKYNGRRTVGQLRPYGVDKLYRTVCGRCLHLFRFRIGLSHLGVFLSVLVCLAYTGIQIAISHYWLKGFRYAQWNGCGEREPIWNGNRWYANCKFLYLHLKTSFRWSSSITGTMFWNHYLFDHPARIPYRQYIRWNIFVTTLPAPITVLSPMVTPGRIFTPAPIHTSCPIVTDGHIQDHGFAALHPTDDRQYRYQRSGQ